MRWHRSLWIQRGRIDVQSLVIPLFALPDHGDLAGNNIPNATRTKCDGLVNSDVGGNAPSSA
jgi:hypothetical protein